MQHKIGNDNGWLQQYQQGGFDALMPKRRSDQGRARRMPVEFIEALLTHKRNHPPQCSMREVIAEVRKAEPLSAEVSMPASTVQAPHRWGTPRTRRVTVSGSEFGRVGSAAFKRRAGYKLLQRPGFQRFADALAGCDSLRHAARIHHTLHIHEIWL